MSKVVELPKLEVNKKIKAGDNGHKLTLKQKIVKWLLKDVHIEELHIGTDSIVIDGDVIKMNPLASDPASPAEGWLWHLAGTTHKPRFHDGTTAKDIGEGAAPGAHDLAGAQHNADTLANLNSKISDATLEDKTTLENTMDSKITTHKGDASAHHTKYTDTEAQNTVKANVEVGDLKTPTKALDMNSQKITGLPTPTAGSDAATKDHVDSAVQGLDWQESVLDELATPPGTPSTGDRYLVIATATGDWTGHEDDIAEWDGSAWDFTTPTKGAAVHIEDVGRHKTYNGTAWVAFGTTIDHGNLIGLADDDHTNYHTDTRAATWHDARNVNTHADITSSGADIEDAVSKRHTQGTDTTLGAMTDDVNMNAHRIIGLAAPTAENDAVRADVNLRAPDSSKLEGSTKAEVQNHAPASHDHAGDTLSPAQVNVGDITFKNGFCLTEDEEFGIVLISPNGKKYRMVEC